MWCLKTKSVSQYLGFWVCNEIRNIQEKLVNIFDSQWTIFFFLWSFCFYFKNNFSHQSVFMGLLCVWKKSCIKAVWGSTGCCTKFDILPEVMMRVQIWPEYHKFLLCIFTQDVQNLVYYFFLCVAFNNLASVLVNLKIFFITVSEWNPFMCHHYSIFNIHSAMHKNDKISSWDTKSLNLCHKNLWFVLRPCVPGDGFCKLLFH